jgi:hypothetical protein
MRKIRQEPQIIGNCSCLAGVQKQAKRLLTLEPPLCREQLMAIESEASGGAESLPILPD